MVDLSIVAMGDARVVRYMRHKGRYPAKDYLDEMPERDRARFFALAKRMADIGHLPSETHGHQLRGEYSDLFEFKPGDSRIFAFLHGTSLYLTSGAPKKKPKTQESDYAEAKNLRRDFLEREATKSTVPRKQSK
ncbi:type II toxin-antitoxin system RelE/ParE family toxin [Gemmatimonas aurantiaca]|uniref:type II toxin-antitoxin system RelE/ParE family toxin n=1 Tax=Gemmatimonas aurantiaca TaxID=173480 RepID=UPI00301D0B41